MKNRKRFLFAFAAALVFFFGLLAVFGVGINNDSEQYITMHIHRDPGYPFFLWLIRLISEEHALIITGVIQAVIAAFCTAEFTDYIAESFRLKTLSAVIIFILALMPHIITPLFSVTTIVLSAGIMSEALCLPLFLLFIKELHKGCTTNSKSAACTGLLLSVVLSLIRAQMMAAILIWLFVFVVKVILEHQYKRILILLVAVGLSFGGRSVLIKTYNYAFQGHFINTTYGAVNILTNVLYASDENQGEQIENVKLQEIFYLLYNMMDEEKYNYKYGGETVFENAAYLESVHDGLKFDVCEAGLKQYLLDKGMDDYIIQNIEADKYATSLTKEILPGCFPEWFSNYILLGIRGTIRNVAIVHPILSVYALIMGAAAIVMMFLFFRKDKESKEAWLMLIALLTVAGIAFSTALTIMCLSRYMVYGFTGFYAAVYLMLLAWLRCRNTNKRGIGNGI